jgi:divalent metal cation (Fe/Co/Zn/Cd) transporter
VYDLILHNYGPNNIIAMAHIQVNDEMKAKKIHRLTRNISSDIFAEFGIIITLGIYACNDE